MATSGVGERRLSLSEAIKKLEMAGEDEISKFMEELDRDMLEAAAFQRQTIEKLQVAGEDVISELMEELDLDMLDSPGLRWYFIKTQSQQNRVFQLYEDFLIASKVLPSRDEVRTMPEKDKELIMFPGDHAKLIVQTRKFMAVAYQFTTGTSNKRVSYASLAKYRLALLFWAGKIHDKYSIPPLQKIVLFKRLTEVMHGSAKYYGLFIHAEGQHRSEVGLNELRQLIDHDLVTTPNIAVAEGHELAWCLMRVCCVRPGSIGWSDKEKEADKMYLLWRDIVITRGGDKGDFVCMVTFRSLKTNVGDPQRGMDKSAALSTLRVKILAPAKTEDLIFSIPHRLLVIALRRNLIVDTPDLDTLLNGTQNEIMIKPEALDEPVIRGSAPRGLGISEGPVSAAALTGYLRTRGEWLGFPQAINYTSIRRRSATDLARRIGNDDARRIMNHDPSSRVLERYYLNLSGTTDLTALALGTEAVGRGQSDKMIQEDHSLAIGAIAHDPEAIRRLHGPALNALVNKLIATSKPKKRSAHKRKLWERRIRHAAKKIMLGEEVQEMRASLQQEEYRVRVSRLESSDFMERVLAQAREAVKTAPDDLDDSSDPLVNQETGLFLQGDMEMEQEEEDLEDQQAGDDGEPPVRQIDAEKDGEARPGGDPLFEGQPEISYESAVRSFMTMLLEGSMSEYRDWKNNPVPCPLCQEDETVPKDIRSKLHNGEIELRHHMGTFLHTPKATWMRKAQLRAETCSDGRFRCPYCVELKRSDIEVSFADIESLMVHVERGTLSAAPDLKDRHDKLKAADGWNDPGWSRFDDEHTRKKHKDEAAKRLKAFRREFSIEYSDLKPLAEPMPHPTHPGIRLGGPPRPPFTHPGITTIPVTELAKLNKPLPESLRGIITTYPVDSMKPLPIPDRLRDAIVVRRLSTPPPPIRIPHTLHDEQLQQPQKKRKLGEGSDAMDLD